MGNNKFIDEKTGEEVTRYNFKNKTTGRKNIYTDILEFDLLSEHLKPLNLKISNFLTNVIKLTNRAIMDCRVDEDIKICFGIEFPKNKKELNESEAVRPTKKEQQPTQSNDN